MNPCRLRGPVAWVVAIALFSVLAGCAPLASQILGGAAAGTNPFAPLLVPEERYVSATPFDTTGIRIRSLRIRRDLLADSVEVSVTTPRSGDGKPSPSLRRALLVPPAAPPCTAGWLAESVSLANQPRWDRPLPLADELDLVFPLSREYLRQPLALDLMIEDATGSNCDRLPLGSPDDSGLLLESRNRGGGGFGLVLARPARSGAQAASIGDSIGVMFMSSLGRWFGHWRLGGRVEACFLSCTVGDFVTVPAFATIDWLFFRGRFVTSAASLGYQVGRIEDAIRGFQGRGTWAHGPRASLLILGPRPFVGAKPTEGFAARGFEAFVQRQFFTVGADALTPPMWLFGFAAVTL